MGMGPVTRYSLSSNFYSLLSSRYSLLVVGLPVMGPGSSFWFCIFSAGSLAFLSWKRLWAAAFGSGSCFVWGAL